MSLPSIIMIANSLPNSSPLYHFAVQWYVHHWLPDKAENSSYDPDYADLPKEFLFTVMCAFSEVRGERLMCKCCTNSCSYHEHESDDDWVAYSSCCRSAS